MEPELQQFKDKKLTQLIKKRKKYKIYLFIMIFTSLVSFSWLPFTIGPIFSKFLTGWLLVLLLVLWIFGFIYVPSFFYEKTKKYNLSLKERILLNFYEGIYDINEYIHSADPKKLNLARKSLSKIGNDLYFNETGFDYESSAIKFFKEFNEILNYSIPKRIKEINETESCLKLYSELYSLFSFISEEKFSNALIYIEKHFEKKPLKENRKLKLMISLPLIRVIMYLFLIVILDLLIWAIFIWIIKIEYSLTYHLPILAILVVIAGKIDSIVLKK